MEWVLYSYVLNDQKKGRPICLLALYPISATIRLLCDTEHFCIVVIMQATSETCLFLYHLHPFSNTILLFVTASVSKLGHFDPRMPVQSQGKSRIQNTNRNQNFRKRPSSRSNYHSVIINCETHKEHLYYPVRYCC